MRRTITRDQWNAKALKAVQRSISRSLMLMTMMDDHDRREVEEEVMDRTKSKLKDLCDFSFDPDSRCGFHNIDSLVANANSHALTLLNQDRDY